jgi:hypothetical protein
MLWYRDPGARSFVLLRYVPWFAGINLAWEIAQLPLYTLWTEASPAYIAFSVVHCTVGDVLIGTAALIVSLVIGREGALAHWHWARIAALTVLIGVGYTVFSEWMNITLLRSWTYAESMPTLEVADFELGLTPLLQWLVVPPLALHAARKMKSVVQLD